MITLLAREIHTGCAEELLPQLPEACLDGVITDIPYGLADAGKIQKLGARETAPVAFELEWDREAPVAWIHAAAWALRPGGAFATFCDRLDPKRIADVCQAAGLQLLSTFYWVKTNPPPRPRQNFCSGVETAVVAFKPGAPRYWGGGGSTPNYLRHALCGGDERQEHPTQKPVHVMQQLVRVLIRPGGWVLDPFCGSGTTLEACIQEERQGIGFERDPVTADLARERIAGVRPPLPGLAAEASAAWDQLELDWEGARLW